MFKPVFHDVIQESDAWHILRQTRITASNMIKVLRFSKSYADQISQAFFGHDHRDIDSTAMRWGRQCEPMAAAAYELRYGVDTVKTGFFTHPEHDFIGGSPDPLVGDDGMTEIKCPYNSNNHIFTITSDQVPDEHIPQIQTNLMITGRKWCDFISFDPRQAHSRALYVKRVYADPVYHDMLIRRCKVFWERLVMKSDDIKRDILINDIPDLF